jgi:hypothetical protein
MMAHLLADVAADAHQWLARAIDAVRAAYESAVDSRTIIDDCVHSFGFDGVNHASQHRWAVRAARLACRLQLDLVGTHDTPRLQGPAARIIERYWIVRGQPFRGAWSPPLVTRARTSNTAPEAPESLVPPPARRRRPVQSSCSAASPSRRSTTSSP